MYRSFRKSWQVVCPGARLLGWRRVRLLDRGVAPVLEAAGTLVRSNDPQGSLAFQEHGETPEFDRLPEHIRHNLCLHLYTGLRDARA